MASTGTARQGRGGAAYKSDEEGPGGQGPPRKRSGLSLWRDLWRSRKSRPILLTCDRTMCGPSSTEPHEFDFPHSRNQKNSLELYGQHPPPAQLGTTARRDARATRTSTRRIYLTSSMSPAHTVSFSRRSSPRFVILRFPQAPTSTVALRLVGGGLPPHGPTMGLAGGVGRGVRSSSTKTPSASRCLRSHGSVMHVLPS